jgi:DNA-binding transcriptional MerR regulator
MDLISIGEAARRLRMRPSALRYYEERKLVSPARAYGKRVYGPRELRRLAFVQIAQRLGIRLDTAAAVLDNPGEQWRAVVDEQIAQLDEMIVRAQEARNFLNHARMCPADHPARDCPHLAEMLDRLLEGASSDNAGSSWP